MGHIAHLINQFKSTHMIISHHLLEDENTPSFVGIERLLYFILPNLNTLHPRMLRAKFDWNLPLEKGYDPTFEKN